jgi:hypothetical protein
MEIAPRPGDKLASLLSRPAVATGGTATEFAKKLRRRECGSLCFGRTGEGKKSRTQEQCRPKRRPEFGKRFERSRKKSNVPRTGVT